MQVQRKAPKGVFASASSRRLAVADQHCQPNRSGEDQGAHELQPPCPSLKSTPTLYARIGCEPTPSLFTGVRGRGILRTSP
jgi:hypothetical protein